MLALFAGAVAAMIAPSSAVASHTSPPSVVTVAGSLQSELGCSGDWQPDCVATRLTYDAFDDVWQRAFAVPAGSWEYKTPLNNSWTENYGANAMENGANIPLGVAGAMSVKFYYDHKSHWITDNRNSVIAVAAGSFQSELGCATDWAPDCLRSWLQDPDGDGVYSFATSGLPAGNYEMKVAIDENWTENYGASGVPNGPNIAFSVLPGEVLHFRYDPATHLLVVGDPSAGPEPPGAPPGSGDADPPETTITGAPKTKTKKRKVEFQFTASEPGSTFECRVDEGPFAPCSSPLEVKVGKGTHEFAVRASDQAGNTDSTPATSRWKVKKKR